MKSLFTAIAAVVALTASGWSSAAPLNIPALCGDAEFVDDPENRIYRGQFKYKKVTLDTALVVTPTTSDDGVVVFYVWGEQPEWDIEEAGCVRSMGTEKGNRMTVRLREGRVRVTYKFSGDEVSVKYKTEQGWITKGKLSLADM